MIRGAAWPELGGRKEDSKGLLFLKKKKQEDFTPFGLGAARAAEANGMKVFWFFFSKKNVLPSLGAA